MLADVLAPETQTVDPDDASNPLDAGQTPATPDIQSTPPDAQSTPPDAQSTPPDAQPTPPSGLLGPGHLTYLGAFRLPQEGGGASRFGYGGWAMTFNPEGDPDGAADGFPGSLYIVGHAYQQMVAEVTIPAPKLQNGGLGGLNVAAFRQPFADITQGMAKSLDQGNGFYLNGLSYLPKQGKQSESSLYWTARPFYNVGGESHLSHGVSRLDLSNPQARGMWRLGDVHPSRAAGYILSVPSPFADTYLGGKRLLSGLFTQQGVSLTSAGPAFYAYAPWIDAADGVAPAKGATLTVTPLVYYPYLPEFETCGNYANPSLELDCSSSSILDTGFIIFEHQPYFPDYQTPDAWNAASWVDLPDAHAVVVVGRRAMGPTLYTNPPNFPVPQSQVPRCEASRGYYGEPYEPRIVFYDPADLAKVAQGTMQPSAVVPYFEWNPAAHMVPTCAWDLGGVSYDRKNRLLYILHRNADSLSDEPQPLIYVFRVGQ